MPASEHGIPMLSPKQAADLIGVTEMALLKWRQKRVGPTYIRQVGRIYYRREDIEAWREANTVRPRAADESDARSGLRDRISV